MASPSSRSAIFAAPATLFDGRNRSRALGADRPRRGGRTGDRHIRGVVRLAGGASGSVPGVIVRIMQPGLRPDINFSSENRHEIVSHYLELSEQDDAAKGIALKDVTMLVWPESAFPFILTRDGRTNWPGSAPHFLRRRRW